MGISQELSVRIDQLHNKGPFTANPIDICMDWIWDFREGGLEELRGNVQANQILGDIVRIFEKHNDWSADIKLGLPPESLHKQMSMIERLGWIKRLLGRRENILGKIGNGFNLSIGEHRLFFRTDDVIPEGGAVQLSAFVNTRIKTSEETDLRIGNIAVDIKENKVEVYEVQRSMPLGSELRCLGDKEIEFNHHLDTQKKRLREAVRQGRNIPILNKGITWPGLEELMMVGVYQLFKERQIISPSAILEIFREQEIPYGPHNRYTFDAILERALGRALLEKPQEYLDRLKKDNRKLAEEIGKASATEGKLAERIEFIGYCLLRDIKSEEVIFELILDRVGLSKKEELRERFGDMDLLTFTKMVLPYTVDYQTNYAPYIVSFNDVGPRITELGKAVTLEQLERLPFVKKILFS